MTKSNDSNNNDNNNTLNNSSNDSAVDSASSSDNTNIISRSNIAATFVRVKVVEGSS